MARIEQFGRERSDELSAFWRESFPLHPMNDFLLAERIFGPPDASPENALAWLDESGRLIAISLLVPPRPPDPQTGERVGGIRWFGVHPSHRGRGIATALLDESCRRLRESGATVADFLSTPPFYIQPGVDIRLTGLIAWLIERGFEHCRTNFNMTVDLKEFHCPAREAIFSPDSRGYAVRRASEGDRESFAAYCLEYWTAHWRDEASQGLRHDPVSLFLAVKREREHEKIVGFASYETNQCLGCFGPTGVTPLHQGNGLGKRLLWATIADMQSLGRRTCEIGWVGPVDFYYHAAGATLGPVFWGMRKPLVKGPS